MSLVVVVVSTGVQPVWFAGECKDCNGCAVHSTICNTARSMAQHPYGSAHTMLQQV